MLILLDVDWTHANLHHANLIGAHLQESHLQGANLQDAQLIHAVLGASFMESASFKRKDPKYKDWLDKAVAAQEKSDPRRSLVPT